MDEIEFATNATDGRYFAKGNRVFKAPHRIEDRGANGEKVFLTSMGFWVCDCNTGISGCAEIVAHVMQHEEGLRAALGEALRELRSFASLATFTTDGRPLKEQIEAMQAILDAATPPAQSAG